MNLKKVTSGEGAQPARVPEPKRKSSRLSAAMGALFGMKPAEASQPKAITGKVETSRRSFSFLSILSPAASTLPEPKVDLRKKALEVEVLFKEELRDAQKIVNEKMDSWQVVNQEAEQQGLKKQIEFKPDVDLYEGDVNRAKIVIEGKEVEKTFGDPLESKLDEIWDFCEGKEKISEEPEKLSKEEQLARKARLKEVEKLFSSVVKMANQELASNLTTQMSLDMLQGAFSVGSSKMGESGGLKEIHLSRGEGGKLICQLEIDYPVCSTKLATQEEKDELFRMRAHLKVEVPEKELQEGITENAKFSVSIERK